MKSVTAIVAVLLGSPALSATINLEFQGTADLVPRSPDIRQDVDYGSNTDFLQIRERVTVEPGVLEAVVSPTLEADFNDYMSLSSSSNTVVSLNLADMTSRHVSRASVNYRATGIARWNRIESPLPESLEFAAPDIPGGSVTSDLFNETKQVVAVGQAGFVGFNPVEFDGAPIDAFGIETFSSTLNFPGVPKVPITPRYVSTVGYVLESDLALLGMTGSLTATNQTTGTVRTIDFLLENGLLDLNLNLDEIGTWDLELTNLGLNNRITSDLTAGINHTVGFVIEFPLSSFLGGEGCGNPATDGDNGNLCAFDTGKAFTASQPVYEDQLSTASFFQTLNTQFGSITVGDDGGPTPVPLPAGFPLYLAAFGGLALLRRQKAQ